MLTSFQPSSYLYWVRSSLNSTLYQSKSRVALVSPHAMCDEVGNYGQGPRNRCPKSIVIRCTQLHHKPNGGQIESQMGPFSMGSLSPTLCPIPLSCYCRCQDEVFRSFPLWCLGVCFGFSVCGTSIKFQSVSLGITGRKSQKIREK